MISIRNKAQIWSRWRGITSGEVESLEHITSPLMVHIIYSFGKLSYKTEFKQAIGAVLSTRSITPTFRQDQPVWPMDNWF